FFSRSGTCWDFPGGCKVLPKPPRCNGGASLDWIFSSTHAEGCNTMSNTTIPVDVKPPEGHRCRSLAGEGLPGQEKAIGNAVCDELKKVGVPASAIRFDKVNERIPAPTQTGNLFVDLPGTRKGPRLLFVTHHDTVPLCAGAKAKREGDRIVSDGTTALGGDNRTGCAVLVTLVETL